MVEGSGVIGVVFVFSVQVWVFVIIICGFSVNCFLIKLIKLEIRYMGLFVCCKSVVMCLMV